MFTDTSKIADARGGEISMLDLWGRWQTDPTAFTPKYTGHAGGGFVASLEKRSDVPLVRLTLADGRTLICGEGSRLALDAGGWASAGVDRVGLVLRSEAGPVAVEGMEPVGNGDAWVLALSAPPHAVFVDGILFLTE
jgi:hypothetical protein